MKNLIEKWLNQLFPPSLPEIENDEELDAWQYFSGDIAGRHDPYGSPVESSARLI
jgi:hypothetical protein